MVKQGTIEGTGGAHNLCFATPGCYDFSVGTGSYPTEITWYIKGPNPDTTQVANGGPGDNVQVCSTPGDDEWTFPPTPTTIACFQIEMADSYGDGWNGASWTWIDQDNNNLMSGTMDAGSSGQKDGLCMYDEGCYTLKVNAGYYPNEIAWTMTETSPSTGSSGGTGSAPATEQICTGSRRLSAGSAGDSFELGKGLLITKTKAAITHPDETLYVDPDYARTKAERKAMGLKAPTLGSKDMDGHADSEVIKLKQIKENRATRDLKAPVPVVEANLNPIPLEILHKVAEKGKAAKKNKVFNSRADAMAYKIEKGVISSGGRDLLSFVEAEAEEDQEEDGPTHASLSGGQRHLLSCNDDCYEQTCDYWTDNNDGWTCELMEDNFMCDCSGCACTNGGGGGGNAPTPSATLCYDVEMFDTYGDGWNGAYWTWIDNSGSIQSTGTLGYGDYGEDVVCIWDGAGPCYTFAVGDGDYPTEITWSLTVDGEVQAEGAYNEQAEVCSDGSGGSSGGGGGAEEDDDEEDDDEEEEEDDDDETIEEPYFGTDDFGYTKHDILHNLTLDNGYSGTDQICFSSEVATSRYRFKVVPGSIDEVVSWTLEGYVYGGGVEKIDIDFAEYDRCSGPGGGALHISQGSVTTLTECTFSDTVASNSVGGAVSVKSDRLLETQVNINGAHFKNAEAGFYGAVMYNAMGLIDIQNTYIDEDSMVYQDGIVFNAGGLTTCVSGCPAGQYGKCNSIDPETITQGTGDVTEPACYSCNISLCFDCEAGRYSANTGGVSESKSCTLCEEGKYQGQVGQSGCNGCAPGFFLTSGDATDPASYEESGDGFAINGVFLLAEGSDKNGATHCNPCPSGYVNSEEDSTSCDSCFSGEYADPGSSTCSKCPAGKYSKKDEDNPDFHDGCKDCEAGKYSASIATVECTVCNSGRYSPDGATECLDCDVGRAQDLEGMHFCQTCGEGKYADEMALGSCKDCPLGTHSNPSINGVEGMVSCTLCPNGTYANVANSACDNCESGKYSATGAQDSCTSCPAGKFSTSAAKSCTACQEGEFSPEGSSTCQKCAAGWYSNAESVGQTLATYEGQESCLQCVAGTRSDHYGEERLKTDPNCQEPAEDDLATDCGDNDDRAGTECPCATLANPNYIGAPRCVDCDVGTYQQNEGGSVCEDCQPGTHNDVFKRSSCTSCLAGSYSEAAAVNCTFCPPGQYADSDEAPSCADCQAGQYSEIGAASCALCSPGTYSAAKAATCTECKVSKGEHAHCDHPIKPIYFARSPPHQHQPLREAINPTV